jgi:hypothetical protein
VARSVCAYLEKVGLRAESIAWGPPQNFRLPGAVKLAEYSHCQRFGGIDLDGRQSGSYLDGGLELDDNPC